MELMVNYYYGLKIFYPTEDGKYLKGCFSDSVDVSNGVLQGNMLALLYFLFMTMTFPIQFSVICIIMFADDAKLYRAIKSKDNCDILQ